MTLVWLSGVLAGLAFVAAAWFISIIVRWRKSEGERTKRMQRFGRWEGSE